MKPKTEEVIDFKEFLEKVVPHTDWSEDEHKTWALESVLEQNKKNIPSPEYRFHTKFVTYVVPGLNVLNYFEAKEKEEEEEAGAEFTDFEETAPAPKITTSAKKPRKTTARKPRKAN
jgi:hypothetical protein